MARKYFNNGACGRSWSALEVSKGEPECGGRTENVVVFRINESVTCELNREQVVDLRDRLDDFLAYTPALPKVEPMMEGEF